MMPDIGLEPSRRAKATTEGGGKAHEKQDGWHASGRSTHKIVEVKVTRHSKAGKKQLPRRGMPTAVLLSALIHAGLFLHSPSPWALLSDPAFDRLFERALRTAEPELHRRRLEELDKYIHDEALMVFTTQRVITAAVRSNIDIPRFSLNGHLDYLVLTTARPRQ